jgi:hypothetical protein
MGIPEGNVAQKLKSRRNPKKEYAPSRYRYHDICRAT